MSLYSLQLFAFNTIVEEELKLKKHITLCLITWTCSIGEGLSSKKMYIFLVVYTFKFYLKSPPKIMQGIHTL